MMTRSRTAGVQDIHKLQWPKRLVNSKTKITVRVTETLVKEVKEVVGRIDNPSHPEFEEFQLLADVADASR